MEFGLPENVYADWDELDSASIVRINYHPDTGALLVELRDSGDIYSFSSVPPEVHAGLLAADSPGDYFNEVVKKREYRIVRKKMP
jgi:hypothetical protein